MLFVVVARSFSGHNVICQVLSVSADHVMFSHKRGKYIHRDSPGGVTKVHTRERN